MKFNYNNICSMDFYGACSDISVKRNEEIMKYLTFLYIIFSALLIRQKCHKTGRRSPSPTSCDLTLETGAYSRGCKQTGPVSRAFSPHSVDGSGVLSEFYFESIVETRSVISSSTSTSTFTVSTAVFAARSGARAARAGAWVVGVVTGAVVMAVIAWLLADSRPTALLLEFVPDDDPERIAAEAAVLRGLFAR